MGFFAAMGERGITGKPTSSMPAAWGQVISEGLTARPSCAAL